MTWRAPNILNRDIEPPRATASILIYTRQED